MVQIPFGISNNQKAGGTLPEWYRNHGADMIIYEEMVFRRILLTNRLSILNLDFFSFSQCENPTLEIPNDFQNRLATMRSRGMSAAIILQNLSQLKALYPNDWESIAGNCDTLLYLGGNELSTHEYISKRLGKETIDTVRPDRALSKVV